jgi:hypothetical protein
MGKNVADWDFYKQNVIKKDFLQHIFPIPYTTKALKDFSFKASYYFSSDIITI